MSTRGKVKAKASSKKSELQARKAAAEAKAAIADVARASRDLAAALTEAVRASHLDERALELAERLRETEAYARGSQLAAETSRKLRDAQLDERAAELAEQLKSSDLATRLRASELAARAQKSSEEALGRAGAWLASGERGKKLGVKPRRGTLAWVLAALGVAVGYVVGTLTAPRRGEDLREEMVLSAQRLLHRDGGSEDGAGAASTQDTRDLSTPPAQNDLADKIRTSLGQDPRTASLPRLNVNVAEGTAFIRGTVPAGFDQDVIREVAAAVEGVTDVDLQVTVTA